MLASLTRCGVALGFSSSDAHACAHDRIGRLSMPIRRLCGLFAAALAFLLVVLGSPPARTQDLALSGQVTSAEEGTMEGVIVSAKREGSTITVSVISNEQGRYAFPAARLDAGS